MIQIVLRAAQAARRIDISRKRKKAHPSVRSEESIAEIGKDIWKRRRGREHLSVGIQVADLPKAGISVVAKSDRHARCPALEPYLSMFSATLPIEGELDCCILTCAEVESYSVAAARPAEQSVPADVADDLEPRLGQHGEPPELWSYKDSVFVA